MKCKNCKILERKLAQLSSKYERVVSLASRGQTIHDVEKTIAEEKLIKIFRREGVFGPQVYNAGFNDVSQSLHIDRLREVVNNLSQYINK